MNRIDYGEQLAHEKRRAANRARAVRDNAPVCRDAQIGTFPLYDATPGCVGKVLPAPGGGVRCDTCRGWFCF